MHIPVNLSLCTDAFGNDSMLGILMSRIFIVLDIIPSDPWLARTLRIHALRL